MDSAPSRWRCSPDAASYEVEQTQHGVDASPAQVAAADALFKVSPPGAAELFTTLDPAAACVAAAHWLTAAATVVGDLAEVDPAAVFAESDNISICSVEIPNSWSAPSTTLTEALARWFSIFCAKRFKSEMARSQIYIPYSSNRSSKRTRRATT
jgi:hypothetical protein